MHEIIKVLIERDGMTYREAETFCNDGKKVIQEAINNGEDAEQEFQDLFGLEPDYLLYLL